MTFVSQLKLYIPKFLTQKKTIALFFALVVLFCAFFVVVYRPLGLLNPPLPLSMLSNRFYTLVLVFSGLVVFTVSRRLLYIVHRRVDMSLSSYLIWIAVEFLFLVVSLTAIAWWLEQNPDATTSATHLKFNILQPESSLVEEFTASKNRKNSSKYTAAMFDHRGYTVIVVFQKDDGNYVLAWAEPEAKDHYRDRLLNSIAFDDANTLAMSYYHGNRTFKYRLNLASKNLRRN